MLQTYLTRGKHGRFFILHQLLKTDGASVESGSSLRECLRLLVRLNTAFLFLLGGLRLEEGARGLVRVLRRRHATAPTKENGRLCPRFAALEDSRRGEVGYFGLETGCR